MNLAFIALAGIGFVLPQAIGLPLWADASIAVLALLAIAVWWAACVFALNAVADFHGVRFADMPAALRAALAPGLQIGGIVALCWFLLSVGLPFYMARGGVFGALAAGVLFWFALILALAIQYYLPLRARLGGGLRKNLRKCFVLFFDNPMFSIFLFAYNAVGLLISLFLAFLLPGLAGGALALDVAVRLRMYKYDWLEANPGADRRSPPWRDLLEEDQELVGKRTLKGMIFPWKE